MDDIIQKTSSKKHCILEQILHVYPQHFHELQSHIQGKANKLCSL